ESGGGRAFRGSGAPPRRSGRVSTTRSAPALAPPKPPGPLREAEACRSTLRSPGSFASDPRGRCTPPRQRSPAPAAPGGAPTPGGPSLQRSRPPGVGPERRQQPAPPPEPVVSLEVNDQPAPLALQDQPSGRAPLLGVKPVGDRQCHDPLGAVRS